MDTYCRPYTSLQSQRASSSTYLSKHFLPQFSSHGIVFAFLYLNSFSANSTELDYHFQMSSLHILLTKQKSKYHIHNRSTIAFVILWVFCDIAAMILKKTSYVSLIKKRFKPDTTSKQPKISVVVMQPNDFKFIDLILQCTGNTEPNHDDEIPTRQYSHTCTDDQARKIFSRKNILKHTLVPFKCKKCLPAPRHIPTCMFPSLIHIDIYIVIAKLRFMLTILYC